MHRKQRATHQQAGGGLGDPPGCKNAQELGGPGVDGREGEREREAGKKVQRGEIHCEDGEQGSQFGEENGAGADGEKAEDQAIAPVGQNGIPGEHREEAGDRHGGGDEEILIKQRERSHVFPGQCEKR